MPGHPPPRHAAHSLARPPARPRMYVLRQLYEQRVLELEQRRELSGKRLRKMWEQETAERQAKQIQARSKDGGRPEGCFMRPRPDGQRAASAA